MAKRWKEPENTKWRLYEYEYAFCPVCGNQVWTGFDYTEQARNNWDAEHLYAYCPHCGTKMFTDTEDPEKAKLKQEAEFLLSNWLLNPCGHKRKKSECGGCMDWKTPVRNDHLFSRCHMNERTRKLIESLVERL